MSGPVVVWDALPPSGVSLYEHNKSLALYLAKLFYEVGGRGAYVMSPEIAAILDTQDTFRKLSVGHLPTDNYPAKIGKLYDSIEIRVEVVCLANTACHLR